MKHWGCEMKKVLTGGRFNIIHPGHIYLLEKAKSLGDCLVVVVASDRTIIKSRKSLIFPEKERKKMVESLKPVDRAVIGYEIEDKSGYAKIIKDEKPDIIALGYDQKVDEKELKKLALKAGADCRIVRIGNFRGYQTKKLLKNKIKGK
jgi:FAD synthetase